jgi:predicted transcriptional regulator
VAEESKAELNEEISIPSNRFMFWAQKVKSFMSNIMTSQITDFKLIEAYDKYLKEIVSYESQYIDSQTEVMNLRYSIDSLVRIIDNLEEKISEMKENSKTKISVIEEKREINPIFAEQIVSKIAQIDNKPIEVIPEPITKPEINIAEIENEMSFLNNVIEYIKSQGGKIEQKSIREHFNKDFNTMNYWMNKLLKDGKIKKLRKGQQRIIILT